MACSVLPLLEACQYCRQGRAGPPPITSPPPPPSASRFSLLSAAVSRRSRTAATKHSPSRKPLLASSSSPNHSALNYFADSNNPAAGKSGSGVGSGNSSDAPEAAIELTCFTTNSAAASAACSGNADGDGSCSVSCCRLLEACLRYIDRKAGYVLAHDRFKALDIDTVSLILSRDSLALTSETVAADALAGWLADRDRSALKGAQYLVRYLTLSPEEVRQSVVGSGLLTPPEEAAIIAFVSGQEAALPEHLVQLR